MKKERTSYKGVWDENLSPREKVFAAIGFVFFCVAILAAGSFWGLVSLLASVGAFALGGAYDEPQE